MCDSDIIYQDENICILNPKLGQGVELIHTVGYVEPLEHIKSESIMDIIEKNGLKSSAQLLFEKGVKIPETKLNALLSGDKNILARSTYMNYDPNTLNRIFFRPPFTAPYKLENDKLVSAGDWKSFLGKEREDRNFFGGDAYSDRIQHTGNNTTPGQGLVTIRVDPDKTYVFYEAMKNSININKNTGMKMPKSLLTPQKKRERYQKSKILLSTFLDNLQESPGLTEDRYEVIATTPIIPACAFDKIIRAGDTSYDGKLLPEDEIILKLANERYDEKLQKGLNMENRIQNLLNSVGKKQVEVDKATYQLDNILDSKLNSLQKWSDIQVATNNLRNLVNQFTDEINKTVDKLATMKFHPLEFTTLDDSFKDYHKSLNHGKSSISRAESMLKKLGYRGGSRRVKRTNRRTRRNRN
jgi:hypothetical protein